MSAPHGKLIVLEGIDGSGTTTQAALLQRALLTSGIDCVLTREPTAGPIGKLIRRALAKQLVDESTTGVASNGSASTPRPVELDARSMALLFAADRADHNQREIEPALSRGALVLSDRYTLSSLLYQSSTGPDDPTWLDWLKAINSRVRRPDLTLVLDTSAEVARRRRLARGGPSELYEVDALQQRLAQAYLGAETLVPGERVEHLDGERSIEWVQQALFARITAFLSVR